MKQFEHTVQTQGGIHARMTGQLVNLAGGYQSQVSIHRGAAKASLKRPIELLSMGVRQGETVTVQVDGPDEDACAAAFAQYMSESI